MQGAVARALFVAVLFTSAPVAASGFKDVDAAGLTFRAPTDAEVTVQAGPAPEVTIVAVTRKDEVLILTLYRAPDRPDARQAMKTHAKALTDQVAGASEAKSRSFSQELLGSKRPGIELRYKLRGRRYKAQVVGAAAKGLTLVTAWVRPLDAAGAFSVGLLKTVKVAN